MGFFTKVLEVLGMAQGAPAPKPEFKPVSLTELMMEKSTAQVSDQPKIEIVDTMKVEIPKEEVKVEVKPKRAKKTTTKKPAAPKKPRAKK